MPSGKNKSHSTLEQKVKWLLEHPSFLNEKLDKKGLVAEMRKDGLIAPSTYWKDINLEEAMRQAKGARENLR